MDNPRRSENQHVSPGTSGDESGSDEEDVTLGDAFENHHGLTNEKAEKFEAEQVEHAILQEKCGNEDNCNSWQRQGVRLVSIMRKLEVTFLVRYQNLLPLVIDGRKSLIDGDALLMMVLSSADLDHSCGGQTLHIIYLIEKYLTMLTQKCVKFSIIFFRVWERFWEKNAPDVAVARTVLRLHLIHNTSLDIEDLDAIWGNCFTDYLEEKRPSFILTYSVRPEYIKQRFHEAEDLSRQTRFFISAQTFICYSLAFHMVDIDSVESDVNQLCGTLHIQNYPIPRSVVKIVHQIIDSVIPLVTTEKKPRIFYPDVFMFSDFKKNVIVTTAVELLKGGSEECVNRNMVQLFLLYSALTECLPLTMRCPEDVPKEPSPLVEKFINQLLDKMQFVLKGLLGRAPFEFASVADIWQGRLFHHLYRCACTFVLTDDSCLGTRVSYIYEELATVVKKEVPMNVFPIGPFEDDHKLVIQDHEEKRSIPQSIPSNKLLGKLVPLSSKLGELFCKEIMEFADMEEASDPVVQEHLRSLLGENQDLLHETHHWHSWKPLTDEYDRVKESKMTFEDKRDGIRHKNRVSNWLTRYGDSLNGKLSTGKTIVTEKKSDVLKHKVKHEIKAPKVKIEKVSKKERIIEENKKRKQQEKLEKDRGRVAPFFSAYKSLYDKGQYDEALHLCEWELLKVGSPNVVAKFSVRKIQVLFKLWCEYCKQVPSPRRRKLSYVEKLFLTARSVLSENNKNVLSQEDQDYLGMVLCSLGFQHIARCFGLKETYSNIECAVGLNWAEFQLKHLGSTLDRAVGGVSDSRVDGYIPDPWQAKLFDIIDKNQSAVVVAPTSSGKTYASYYCMEKVLRASDDGVVVYVCPTKALVNQVAATVYSRFRKQLPAGMSMMGIFTRDFKENVFNCQILTTVPECLELLLLSPRRYSWVNHIRYVIFDEVHCLVGQSGGVAWENCMLLIQSPYLALSATINKPEKFCSWLQKVEDFKKERAQADCVGNRSPDSYQVHLVVHLDRHSHLVKNILHADGSLEHVHPYGLLEEAVLRENKGTPEHVSVSPAEALELYNTMREKYPDGPLSGLAPDIHFSLTCKSGFLTMPSVKNYFKTLRDILCNPSYHSERQEVIRALKPNIKDDELGKHYVYDSLPLLVETLREKDMLPALVFSYSRNMVSCMPTLVLKYLKEQDDDEEEETEVLTRDQKKRQHETGDVDNDTSTGKKSRRHNTRKFRKMLGLLEGKSMSASEGSLRGEGSIDENTVNFIERRLMAAGWSRSGLLPCLLRKGLGKHFGGMNAKERSAVEMLFRMKMLNLVCATGTLALGIHMPCKTVVVAGDSPYLNALEFQQMSGRVGRRGFDLEGNVIFLGIGKLKMLTMLTSSMPEMTGHLPLNMSLIMRLLHLIDDVTDKGLVSEHATKVTVSRALTVLENSLIYETRPELKMQMKHFFLFAVQAFISQGLINDAGQPRLLSALVTHLHYHSPGVFAFAHLIQSGVFERLCDSDEKGHITSSSQTKILTVLSALFAPLPLSRYLLLKKRNNSRVILPELPEEVVKDLQAYNKKNFKVFHQYFNCVADYVVSKSADNKLPLSQLQVHPKWSVTEGTEEEENEPKLMQLLQQSCGTHNICSAFAALSGRTDKDVFSTSGKIRNIRHEIFPDGSLIPVVPLYKKYNSYALDFYTHGIKEAIIVDNGLKEGSDFELLRDFAVVLKSISVTLEEMFGPEERLVKAITGVSEQFQVKFYKAYYGYQTA